MNTNNQMKPNSFKAAINLLLIVGMSGLGFGLSKYYLLAPIRQNKLKNNTHFYTSSRYNISSLPHNKEGNLIRYGYKLITETSAIIGPDVKNPSMRYAGNNLACQNCHLDAGHKKFAAPFIGVTGQFPQYNKRSNKVITIEERINGCMQRSMNGRKLPINSREMLAMVAYMHWLSRGVPSGEKIDGTGFPKILYPDRKASLVNGEKIFMTYCTSCHGKNGQGLKKDPADPSKGYQFPPLWGKDSFNRGAGMHRLLTAAAFIKSNMPFGVSYNKPVLTNSEAYDVAAYINSKERPGMKGLSKDYPILSMKPVDCPYPPYADHFSQHQHQFGPFQPIIKAKKK